VRARRDPSSILASALPSSSARRCATALPCTRCSSSLQQTRGKGRVRVGWAGHGRGSLRQLRCCPLAGGEVDYRTCCFVGIMLLGSFARATGLLELLQRAQQRPKQPAVPLLRGEGGESLW
jgi:hypothetical protein